MTTMELGAAGRVRRGPPASIGPSSVRTPAARPIATGRFDLGRVEAARVGPFVLESGAFIPELTVAYRHDGRNPTDAPQILVVHALTGSADAAGDWWEPLIGPGRALDTERFGVLSANLLGGRYGTTGPTSIDPVTGDRYGRRFPHVTARDQARAQWALLDHLGVERLALVVGGSLGGMVALEVALERPSAVDVVMPIAAPAATGAMAIAWNHVQLRLIEELGDEGLRLARQLAMTTYRSEADFEARFGRRTEPDGRASIVSYLAHQGDKLLDRFDVDTYRVLVEAMDGHDIARGRGTPTDALRPLAGAGAGMVGVGITGDLLYGPEQVRALVASAQAAGIDARYREIASSKGHDAFLVEWPQLGAILGEALAQASAPGAVRARQSSGSRR